MNRWQLGRMKGLPLGKIPIDVLNRTVLRMTGARTREVLTGPKAGLDFAVVRAGSGYLVTASDPITGVSHRVGRHAVAVSANDVATSGNRPQFLESIILMPEDANEANLSAIASDMHEAAKRLGISIVGGHTEVTPGLERPIVIVTAFSFVKSFVTSQGANEGDAILMTKTAGLEGTLVLAEGSSVVERRLPARLVSRAMRLEGKLTIVDEAVRAFQTGAVHAMHDCTEGGVLGAVYEMSVASGTGFELNEAAVPTAPATREICTLLGIDPIRLISSGALLIAVPKQELRRVVQALDGTQVTEIGSFSRGGRYLLREEGSREEVRAAPADELWRTLESS